MDIRELRELKKQQAVENSHTHTTTTDSTNTRDAIFGGYGDPYVAGGQLGPNDTWPTTILPAGMPPPAGGYATHTHQWVVVRWDMPPPPKDIGDVAENRTIMMAKILMCPDPDCGQFVIIAPPEGV